MTQNLNLKAIRIDGGTQSRVALNLDTVADYEDALANGYLPPVLTVFDGTDHWLVDGFHRYHAYAQSDRASIPADVRTGTQRDAVLLSCGSNAKHGLRRTNEDKRKAVVTLLADPDWTQWSDREIARRCEVGHTLVSTIRSSLAEMPVSGERKVTNKHGTQTVMNTAKIGKGKPADPPAEPPAPAAVTQTPVPKPSTDGTGAAPALSEAEQNAKDAYDTGETDAQLIARLEKELAELHELLEVCEAVDLKAEVLKWRRMAAIAQARQGELMGSAHESAEREKWMKRHLLRCGKAAGEGNPTRIAVVIEAHFRKLATAAVAALQTA
jgi:hypothetical protein